MKKIFIIIVLLMPVPMAWSCPLIVSQTSADLSTLSFYTTDTLQVAYEPMDGIISATAKIYNEDVVPLDPRHGLGPLTGEEQWSAETYDLFNYYTDIHVSGSGWVSLVDIEFTLYYAIAPLAQQVTTSYSMEDDAHFYEIELRNLTTGDNGGFVNNEESMLERNITHNISQDCIDCWRDPVFFNDGDTGRIHIGLAAAAGGAWVDRPGDYPQPVPEPTAIILMGCGLIGIIGKRKWSKNKLY